MKHVLQPRLLPLTIFVLALLLAVKSGVLLAVMTGAGEVVRSSMLPAAQAAGHDGAEPTQPAKANKESDKAGTAANPANEKSQAVASKDGAAVPPGAEAKSMPAQDPPFSDSERALLLELRQRREQIDAREAGLATRAAVLVATERKLAGRVVELQALQKKLETLEASRVQREETGWQGLVKVYETMKPRDAAVILNDLDMKVLLQVLDRMKEGKAALILSAMHPERAREVTDGLARMRVRDVGASGSG